MVSETLSLDCLKSSLVSSDQKVQLMAPAYCLIYF